jgi:hypothetical protein
MKIMSAVIGETPGRGRGWERLKFVVLSRRKAINLTSNGSGNYVVAWPEAL